MQVNYLQFIYTLHTNLVRMFILMIIALIIFIFSYFNVIFILCSVGLHIKCEI